MKAFRIPTGRVLAPFGDPIGEARVLDRPLAQVQDAALAAAGLQRVDAPPAGEPFLVFTDRLWFTADLARRVAAAGPGRLQVAHPGWSEAYEGLQQLAAPGVYDIGVHPAAQSPDLRGGFPALPERVVDLGLEEHKLENLHQAMAFAADRPLLVGPALLHQIDHWSHLLRANLLALAARGAAAKQDWDQAPGWKKLLQFLGFLLKVRPTSRADVLAGLTEKGKRVRVHPTATVELCHLEDDVEIGPYAVVRGSWLGRGAKVEEFCSVNLAVLGEGAKLGRYGMLNLSVVYPGAFVSKGNGYQACVVGRDAFLAWGVTALDLSFGGHVQVEVEGQLVDSGQHFLGVCVGHRARVGHAVRLNYGATLPNEAFLVGPSHDLLRRWGDAPAGEILRVEQGRAVPVKRRES